MSDAEWAVLLVREAAALRFHPPLRSAPRPEKDSVAPEPPNSAPPAGHPALR